MGSGATATGLVVTPETAMECPAVQAVIGLLANTVATLPLDLFERVDNDTREKATANPLYTLMHDAPNEYQTSAEFRAMMHTDLLQWNNAYARIRTSGGGPVALDPINPRAIYPFRYGPDMMSVAYQWTPLAVAGGAAEPRREQQTFQRESRPVHAPMITDRCAKYGQTSRWFTNCCACRNLPRSSVRGPGMEPFGVLIENAACSSRLRPTKRRGRSRTKCTYRRWTLGPLHRGVRAGYAHRRHGRQ
jgi:hypothetical protein